MQPTLTISDRRRLKAWMSALHLSQSEMARRLTAAGVSISQRAICDLMDVSPGRTNKHPRKPTKAQLAVAMGIPVRAFDDGPQATAEPALIRMEAAHRDNPEAMLDWRKHRLESWNNGTYHGTPPDDVKAISAGMAALVQHQIPASAETAAALVTMVDRVTRDSSTPEWLRVAALGIRQGVVSGLGWSIDPTGMQSSEDHDDVLTRAEDLLKAVAAAAATTR